MSVFTELTVIFIVQPTVKTTRATYKVDRVLTVNLDGLERIAMQVRWPLVKLHIFYLFCLFQSYFITLLKI